MPCSLMGHGRWSRGTTWQYPIRSSSRFLIPCFGQPLKGFGSEDTWNCCRWELQFGAVQGTGCHQQNCYCQREVWLLGWILGSCRVGEERIEVMAVITIKPGLFAKTDILCPGKRAGRELSGLGDVPMDLLEL